MQGFIHKFQAVYSKQVVLAFVVLLLGVHFLLSVSSALHKSNTYDEIVHLTAGYAYWTEQDYRFDPENGNLPKRVAALPLLFMDLDFPFSKTQAVFQDFFFNLGNPVEAMLFRARAMIALLSVMLGVVVFLWSRSLFGNKGALVSLGMYAFSPTMIAHGRLVTSDMAGALFFVASLWALSHYLKRPDLRSAMIAGATLGGLMVSKMSWILILPVGLALSCVHLLSKERWPTKRTRVKQWGMYTFPMLSLAILMVWAFYGFKFHAAPLRGMPLEFAQNQGFWKALIDFKVLPESFLAGLWDVFEGLSLRDGYLNGKYSINGWWYFFPFCFLVKTPVTTQVLLVLTGILLAFKRPVRIIAGILPLLIFVAVYMGFAMSADMNIGHRHLLPVYPALFIMVGALPGLAGKGKWMKCLIAGCLCVLGVQAFIAWPHYLSFFNLASGGPSKGHERLVDSSLDWGQDLPALKKWADNRPDQGMPVYLSYFGTSSPDYYGIQGVKISPMNANDGRVFALTPGWYCISATYLHQVYTGVLGPWSMPFENRYWELIRLIEQFPAEGSTLTDLEKARIIEQFKRARFARLCHVLRQRQPDAMAGYSICIYRVGKGELERALWAPMEGLPPTRSVKGAGEIRLF